MFFESWFKKIAEQAWWAPLCRSLDAGESRWFSGTWGPSRALLAAAVTYGLRRPVCIVIPTEEDALVLYEELRFFLQGLPALSKGHGDVSSEVKYPTELDPGEDPLVFFPAQSFGVVDSVNREQGKTLERLLIMRRLARGESFLMVTSIEAMAQKVSAPEALAGLELKLEKDRDYSMDTVCRQLIDLGYRREQAVDSPGQFARRGGILDVATPNTDEPVRLEFFGDTLVSLRTFDPGSQRRRGELESVDILPFQELLVDDDLRQEGIARVKNAKLKPQALKQWLDRLEEQRDFSGQDWLVPFFYPDVTLFDYLECVPGKPLLFIDQAQRMHERLEDLAREAARLGQRRADQGALFPQPDQLLLNWDGWIKCTQKYPAVYTSLLNHSLHEFKDVKTVSLTFKSHQFHQGDLAYFKNEVIVWGSQDRKILLACQSEGDRARARELLEEKGLPCVELNSQDNPADIEVGRLGLALARLDRGFDAPALGLTLVSDQELFHRQKLAKPRIFKHRYKGLKGAKKIESFAELNEGDYAVHVNHGIAIFQGVVRMNVDGFDKDFVSLEYKDRERLYVPVDQVDMIQKYLGGEENPHLHKLGAQTWIKAREKVAKAVAEMAEELLNLYARRQVATCEGTGPDTRWQHTFEASFPFSETPDQLNAIEQVKADLESKKPADRLVCGDVGFGKTEVAMRAAFKTVMAGRQVAVLVPTTILAQQHWVNFSERMGDYPVRVGLLSRFRTPAQQRRTINELAEGKLDLVIGTHRLLGKDVKFKNIGLVVVDEEQRFGVSHKEKLKKFRSQVDVITMSATPIPRTLHLSLSGIRDMSIIETPPLDRLPIRTYVVEDDQALQRDAIMQELNRQGQIFFVHNRVKTIDKVAEQLRKIVPEAKVAVGHGQMPKEELEQVMTEFMGRAHDILVATTIIESGLDIPNVNTIIINHAEDFGLSQLYQLRGRVGRSERQAYAYLFYPKDKSITEIAEKRLAAIEGFTELGSGFKVAMRDLEIRGVGNLLGSQQHGQVAAVGFDLYCHMLNDAVSRLKGEEVTLDRSPKIDLDLDAYIPDDTVPDPKEKMELYKRLSRMEDPAELEEMRDEFQDRYGDSPPPVIALLEAVEMKIWARRLGLSELVQRGNRIVIRFWEDSEPSADFAARMMEKHGSKVRFLPGPPAGMSLEKTAGDGLARLREFLPEILPYVTMKKQELTREG